MAISFQSPWWFISLMPIAVILWFWWKKENRFTKRKKRLILFMRFCIFLLLTCVLARTSLWLPAPGQFVVFVIDRSASVVDINQASDFIQQAIAKKRPDDQYAIVSVGKYSVVEQSWTKQSDDFSLDAVIEKDATDLASGLQLAKGLLPNEATGKIVLMSDGKETKGSAKNELELLQQRGIPVEIVALTTEQGSEVLIDKFDVPKRLHQGEKYQVKVQVTSSVRTTAKLRLYTDEKLTAEQSINIKPGEHQYQFTGKINQSGYVKFRAEIEAEQDTVPMNNQYDSYSHIQGQPTILMIEGTPHAGQNVATALQSSGMKVERRLPLSLPEQAIALKRYSSIILVDTPADAFTQQQLANLRTAVKDLGIGLVATGGENAYALGGWFQTPLEDMLPVRMDLQDKQRFPSLGLVLVIDKSGSMVGEKIELAKEAALRSAQILAPHDQLGVLTFDNQHQWVLSPKHVTNRIQLEQWIKSISANGGTNIYPALQQAYQAIQQVRVKKKHVILLTDGQSPEGKYDELVQKMKKGKITLSTISIGKDADRDLLKQLAEQGQGRFYQVDDPASIPTIVSKEAILSKRSYLINQLTIPQVTGGQEWKWSQIPPLQGYVGTTSKQTAEVVLASTYPDPILARWQYGLGRTVAWTSDVNGKWSQSWIIWPGFANIWNQIVSWTFPQVETSGWMLQLNTERKESILQVTGPDQANDISQLKLTFTEENQQAPVILKPTAPGKYEGKFPVEQPGTYVMKGEAETANGTQSVGIFVVVIPYSKEYQLMEHGNKRLKQLASIGGTQLLKNPERVFGARLSDYWLTREISFTLFFITALLWPVDIAIRRLSFHHLRFFQQKQVGQKTPLQQQVQSVRAKRKQQTKWMYFPDRKIFNTEATKHRIETDNAVQTTKKATVSQDNGWKSETHSTRLLAAKRNRNQKE